MMNKKLVQAMIILLSSVAWTLSYEMLYDLIYILVPEEMLNGLEYAFIDSLACLFLIICYSLVYYWLIADGKRKLNLDISLEDYGRGLILGFAVGGFSNLWFLFVEWLLSNGNWFPQTIEQFDQSWDYTLQESYLWVFLSIVVLGPIVEEILFRGIIFKVLEHLNKSWVAVFISALLFGIWHGQPVQMGYTFIAGLVFGLARLYSGGILLPIFIHIINNLLSTLPDSWYAVLSEGIGLFSWLAMIPAYYILKEWLKETKTLGNS